MAEIKDLSILIPVYNYDIRKLVKALSRQIESHTVPAEIICLDDASEQNFKNINREVGGFPFVRYSELQENAGRSRIRNMLARMAAFNHFLFIDCDSGIVSESYLQNYITASYAPVIIGGRVYTEAPPSNPDYYLHWLCGSRKEVKPAHLRNEYPYDSLMFNNILVRKKEYLQIQLDESLDGYGHEDTKFGFDLLKNNIAVIHIDNPVVHEGLDEKESFLDKTHESVKNLYKITVDQKSPINTKLIKTYNFIKISHLTSISLLVLKLIYPLLKKNLVSGSPSLLALDLFKLKCFLEERN